MRRVIVFGAYGRYNLGDDYMLFYVNNYLLHNNIEPHYYYHGEEYYFPDINGIEKEYRCVLNTDGIPKFKKILETLKWLKKDEQYDALILMGGGYTNEKFGIIKLLKLFLMCFKYRNKGVYILGQTVGPYKSTLGMFLITGIYNSGKYIFTREQQSSDFLFKHKIKNHLVGDDAFLELETVDRKEKITVVSYKDFYNYELYKKIFFDAILRYAKESKDEIVVIPFTSDETSNEFKINKNLVLLLQENGVDCRLEYSRSVSKFNETMRKSRRVISSAYHAITIGKKYGSQTIGLYAGDYYKMKMEGILKWYNEEQFAINMAQLEDINLEKLFEKNNKDYQLVFQESKKISMNVKNAWKCVVNDING